MSENPEWARLVDAAQGWLHSVLEHSPVDPGAGPECQYCPLCRLIAYVRSHPDLVRSAAETVTPAAEPRPDVEHIAVD